MKFTSLLIGLAMAVSLMLDQEPEWPHWSPPSDAGAELVPLETDGYELVLAVRGAAQRHGIPPRMLEAMAEVESNFDPLAVSRAGAVGILQIVPESAGREVYRLRGLPGQPSRDALFQAEYNADIAAQYMAWLERYFGDAPPEVRVAAFNAGPTRVASCLRQGENWVACLPRETREYLSRVDRASGGLEQFI